MAVLETRVDDALRDGAPAEAIAALELELAEVLRKRGDAVRARALCEATRARVGPADGRAVDGHIAILASRLAWDEGSYDHALREAEAAFRIFQVLGDEEGVAQAHLESGKACSRLHDAHAAREHYQDALEIYKRLGNVRRMAAAHNNLGIVYKDCGNWVRAIEHLEEAIRLDRAVENEGELPYRFLNLGIVHLKMGSWESAREHLEAARAAVQRTGNTLLAVDCLLALGNYYRLTRQSARATALYADALAAAQRSGFRRELALAHEFRGDLAWEGGRVQDAITEYRQALTTAEGMSPDGDVTAEVSRRLAEACVAVGQLEEAQALVERSIAISVTRGDRYEEGAAHRVQGLLFVAAANGTAALVAFDRSAERLRSIDERFELAKTLFETGRVLQTGPPESRSRAWRLLKEASYHFEQLGATEWVVRVDRELMACRPEQANGAAAGRRPATLEATRVQAQRFVEKGVVTQSPLMIEVLEMVEKAARSRFCILLQGETGTGKERLARAIHLMGGHPPDRFIAVNCNSLPEGLQESELFGHRRGAFTGAQADKPGLFEIAEGGTLFLDEVTDLSPAAQGKILRIIEDGELRRLGDVKTRRINVRILAATNKPAIEEVRGGRFRKDLFYRLSVFPVTLPPLRERTEDVALLADFFLARERAQEGKPVALGADALEALEAYEWPGNVRELENLLCRLYVLADAGSTVRRKDIPPEILVSAPARGATAVGLRERLEVFERDQIERALRTYAWDKERTAAALGITRRWLTEKMRRYTLERSGTIVPLEEGAFPDLAPANGSVS